MITQEFLHRSIFNRTLSSVIVIFLLILFLNSLSSKVLWLKDAALNMNSL